MSDVPPSHPYQTQHATGLSSSQPQPLQQQSVPQTPSQQHPYPSRYGALSSLPSPLGSNTSHHGGTMDQLSYTSHASADPSSNTVHMYAYHPSPSHYPQPSYNVGSTTPTAYPYHLQPSHYAVTQHPYHHLPQQQRIPSRIKTNDPSVSESSHSPKVHYNSMFGRSTSTYGHSSTMRMASTMYPMMEYRAGPPLMAGHQPPPTFIPSVPVPQNLGYFGRGQSPTDLITPQETSSTSILCGYCGTSQCELIVQGCGHGFHHHCVVQTWTDKSVHCFTCLHAIQRLKSLMSIPSSGTVNTLATYALLQQQQHASFVSPSGTSLVSPSESSTEEMPYTQDPHTMVMTVPSDLSPPASLTGSSRARKQGASTVTKRLPKQQRRPPPIDTTREIPTLSKGDTVASSKPETISLSRPVSITSTSTASTRTVLGGEVEEKADAQPQAKTKTTRTGGTRGTGSGKKALKVCAMPNCGRTVRSRGLCKGHGGGRRCGFTGCGLSDQGGGFCISHGGGKRCQHPDCDNSAQSRGLCKLHGGGSRCQVDGCTKSSQGAGLCRAHGGGRRCQVEGCNKTDRRAGLCVSHGINRKCLVEDCSKTGRIDGLRSKHQYERTQTLAPLLARRQMDEGVATLAGAAFALDGENEGQVASSVIKTEKRSSTQRQIRNEDGTEGGETSIKLPSSSSSSPAFAVMASLSLQSLFTPMTSPTTPTVLAGLMSTAESMMRTRGQEEEHRVEMGMNEYSDGDEKV